MMTAANKNVSLLEALRQMGADRDADFLRDGARLLAQRLIELEATEMIGADRYERTPERCTSRNGYRDRQWDTRVGKLDLKIPKVREGTFFPSFLVPRRSVRQVGSAWFGGQDVHRLTAAPGVGSSYPSGLGRRVGGLLLRVHPVRFRRCV